MKPQKANGYIFGLSVGLKETYYEICLCISLGKKEMVIIDYCTLSTSQKHFSLLYVQKLGRNSINFHINCELVLS